ncbi:SDR family oxidoreductase [Metabacillus malikii]|uniref:NAD(P)-dependent dehydrogenase (Short-subunit alcohol dehydrogenase family) n=1 Tax=Metabacillus malikii TaxID=1504265 RepID=A0ABT9ZEV7_9BACI|nr:SDR family oxidoreductase [Metabacillus malikii]MDQ0230800.1 NAD(P)-dependent dehydrogenase (short-subunit alcohol dehydrogenase family) [Metabacillus malikii]
MNQYPIYPYYAMQQKCQNQPITFPPQHQNRHPGIEANMVPRPISENPSYKGSNKLKDKVAIITGGDSGIGRAVAYAFVKEGANVVIPYLNEHRDAKETKQRIEELGGKCLLIPCDLKEEKSAKQVVEQTVTAFGKLDILINNHAIQIVQKSILDISAEQLEATFRTNIFSFFYLVKAGLPHLKDGSSIINTTSITAYEGHKTLIDYSATKGAITTFTRSLSLSLVNKGIRVNAVAPGPIWTPLIPSSFSAKNVATFGLETEMKRAGQPFELAPTYVYLASDDSRYVTGQVLHVNGGQYRTS